MSWANIRAAAAASQLEYSKAAAELAELTHYKLQVDEYGVWKVKARKTPDSEPQLITARGGAALVAAVKAFLPPGRR